MPFGEKKKEMGRFGNPRPSLLRIGFGCKKKKKKEGKRIDDRAPLCFRFPWKECSRGKKEEKGGFLIAANDARLARIGGEGKKEWSVPELNQSSVQSV